MKKSTWFTFIFGETFIHSPTVKFFTLFFSATLIIYLLVGEFYRFQSYDAIPQIQLIDMKMRKEIRDFTAIVKTGIHIRGFSNFDIDNDNFITEMLVWFECNADEVMPEVIDKFSFIHGDILYKSDPDAQIADNKMLIKYMVKVKFNAQLSHRHFPFDGHKVSMQMVNNFVSPGEMHYVTEENNFALGQNLFSGSWELTGIDTAWGYLETTLDATEQKKVKKPIAIFTINVKNTGTRQALILFFPLLATLLLSLFAFIIGVIGGALRFRMSLSALGTMIGYRFVIQRIMPDVGYFTTTDAIYSLFLAVAFLSFIGHSIVERLLKKENAKEVLNGLFAAEVANSIFFFALNGALLAGIGLILW